MYPATSTLKREHENSLPPLKRQKQETISCSNILDIPDEMLIKIFQYTNARERLALGNCCKKFNSLVFGDKTLLSNLDFSEEGRLTSAADVRRYFNDKDTCIQILKVNIKNTNCIKPGYHLNNSIGKAANLVDVNIHGIEFKDVWQMGSFLQPLLHLQRLSIDWTGTNKDNIPICHRALQKPFGRLIYLSVEMKSANCFESFVYSLELCQELMELRMVVKEVGFPTPDVIWIGETRQLRNLKIVDYFGGTPMAIKRHLVPLLPDPEKWANLQVYTTCDKDGFFLCMFPHQLLMTDSQASVFICQLILKDFCKDVCEELLGAGCIESIPNAGPENQTNFGWKLYPELLLKHVIQITHLDVPEEFCCLTTFMNGKRCLMNVEDTKRLLKNPRSQISYLYVNHCIEIGCDLHLIASAFPNLTELVLAGMKRDLSSLLRDTHFERRLRRRGSVEHEKEDDSLNMDSSFKMLVDNTPHMRHLTLGRKIGGSEEWEPDDLYLIKNWKNLKTLRLWCIRIEDGGFLIEIGKRCKYLQKLELVHLYCTVGYKKELLKMLTHCNHLRDFSIIQNSTCMSEVFTSLASNVELRRVCAQDIDVRKTISIKEWISPIEQLLHRCSKLTTFITKISVETSFESGRLDLVIKRLKSEINRPNLQIQILHRAKWGSCLVDDSKAGRVHEDTPHLSPFP